MILRVYEAVKIIFLGKSNIEAIKAFGKYKVDRTCRSRVIAIFLVMDEIMTGNLSR